jgi:hypothetical protein
MAGTTPGHDGAVRGGHKLPAVRSCGIIMSPQGGQNFSCDFSEIMILSAYPVLMLRGVRVVTIR